METETSEKIEGLFLFLLEQLPEEAQIATVDLGLYTERTRDIKLKERRGGNKKTALAAETLGFLQSYTHKASDCERRSSKSFPSLQAALLAVGQVQVNVSASLALAELDG